MAKVVNKKHSLKKYCRKCKIELNNSNWLQHRKDYICISCNRAYGNKRYHDKYKNIEYRNKKKAYDLFRLCDITVQKHKQTYIEQNGCCAICNNPVPYDKINTDHNHKTNKFRGLLCVSCNLFSGRIENNLELTKKIIKYLEKHNGQS